MSERPLFFPLKPLCVIAGSEAGKYTVPVRLKSGGSAMFNVSEFIAMQEPGLEGNKIPPETTHGSAVLWGATGYPDVIKVGVGIGIFNVLKATCGTTCPTCFGYTNFQVQSLTATVPVGGTAQFTAMGLSQNNVWQNVSSLFGNTWSSSNSGVASSQSGGNFKGVAPGSFTASSNVDLIEYPADCAGRGAPCPFITWAGSQDGEVTPTVTIGLFSQNPILQGNTATVQVTVNPSASIALAISSSGNGRATFGQGGGTSMTISGTSTVNIYGSTVSSTSGDLTLTATYGGYYVVVRAPFSVTSGACTLSYTSNSGSGKHICPSAVTITDTENISQYCTACSYSCTTTVDSTFTPNAQCAITTLDPGLGLDGTLTASQSGNFSATDCNIHNAQIIIKVTDAHGHQNSYNGGNIGLECTYNPNGGKTCP